MKDYPKISIIIPMHNAEKYIGECLDSIIRQTYKNLEIIIIDDGSKDNSLAIASRYENIKIIKQENAGVSVARNIGLDAAGGDWISFVDADDYLATPEFYENIRKAFDEQIDIIVCGYIDEKRPGRPAVAYKELRTCRGKQEKISASRVARHPAVWRFVYRREFLNLRGLRFEPRRITGEDVMFSIPAVFYARAIATVPGALYWYRRTPTGAMRDPERLAIRLANKNIVWSRAARFAIRNHFFLGFRRSFWKWVKLIVARNRLE
jgi:glycosyltransferase EpsJ